MNFIKEILSKALIKRFDDRGLDLLLQHSLLFEASKFDTFSPSRPNNLSYSQSYIEFQIFYLSFFVYDFRNLVQRFITDLLDKMKSSLLDFFEKARSSHLWRCSAKKVVLKHFSIFTGKHLCWSLFCNKVVVLRSATLSKWESNTCVFLWILRSF